MPNAAGGVIDFTRQNIDISRQKLLGSPDGGADCTSLGKLLFTATNPRRPATRFPRKRFPISTRFQNVMNAFGVLAEKVLADAGLSSENFS